MRYATALAVAAHAAIAVVACHDRISPDEVAGPEEARAVAGDALHESLPADTLSIASLDEIDSTVDSLMLAIQEDEANVAAMVELARLYAGNGWFEDAIGPLARAVELEPARSDLLIELGIALGRSGGAAWANDADLAQAAREFVETVARWGHGC